MLVPWTTSKLVTIVEDEIRFWNGSKIYLCHCKDEKDRFKYLGSEIHVLCCERNELAVMGDGSLCRIGDLKVGDSVMTLRGPRKITWVGSHQLRPCVRATVYTGGRPVEQVHSETHAVLTPEGWRSYADSSASGSGCLLLADHSGSGGSLGYSHPYTGDGRSAEVPVGLGGYSVEPCGERWTIDITVEDENHYITAGGFVNRNCIDELTTFTPTIYRFLRSRVRMAGVNIPSQFAGMFPRILSASNPGGIGHSFVKAMFIDARAPMEIEEVDSSEGGMLRQFIPARLSDNPSIDPDSYVGKLEGLGSPALVKAMRDGDWNVVAGAFFPEFSTDQHVIAPVSLPVYWQRFRSFDWGSARPFCVLWYAVSDGELADFPRGALVVYREWYGAPKDSLGLSIPNVGLRLTAEEVADGIAEREKSDLHAGRVMTGVADPSIFHENGGPSIADRMSARKVFWRPADNARVARNGAMGGWDQVRARLKGDGERPGLYIFSTCRDLIRTLPAVQHDEGRPEDLDTDGDDHGVDSLRYGVTSRPYVAPLPPDSDPHEPDRYARRWKPARRTRGSAMSA